MGPGDADDEREEEEDGETEAGVVGGQQVGVHRLGPVQGRAVHDEEGDVHLARLTRLGRRRGVVSEWVSGWVGGWEGEWVGGVGE